MTDPTAPVAARRRWRRWAVLAAIVLLLLAAAAALVVWAPWRSPPPLRPAGLTADSSTTSSVAFHWARPATGPAPDRYLIMHEGRVVASVPGSATSYRRAGLAPDTAYQYQVTAERGGKRSAPSAAVTVTTSAPPLSQARWEGPWTVDIRIVHGGSALRGKGPKGWTEPWRARPRCPAGPCTVRISGGLNRRTFTATLTRSGSVYHGTTKAAIFRCGSHSDRVWIHSTLAIRVTLTKAQVNNGTWAAGSWAGRMVISSPHTSTATFYCTAFTLTTTLSASF